MLGRFVIHEPRSVEEACARLIEHGPEAAVYAGGTELLVLMKEGLAHFPHLVNIKTIPGLAEIEIGDNVLRLGPLVTHRAIEQSPLVRAHAPLLAELASQVANPRVRATGTLGGNLCFAEPHSDPATLLAAWGATMTLTSASSSREVPAGEFFTGLLETARRQDELLTAITVPLQPSGVGSAYERFKTHERPTATVAAVVRLEGGVVVEARLVAGSVGPRPERLIGAERVLTGRVADPDAIEGAAARAADDVEVTEDQFESSEYKRQLVRVLVRRAVRTAVARCGAATSSPGAKDSGLSPISLLKEADGLPSPYVGGGAGGEGSQPASAGLLGLARGLQPRASSAPGGLGETTLSLRLTVNGRPVEAEVEPRTILLDFVRDQLNLTGAKRSCDLQVCGACTVLLDGTPVSACCTLAYEAHGRELTTIEGLARYGELHPIQQAFIDRAAIQCGFCTPGMILTTKALLAESPSPTQEQIRGAIGGNLCRCTGYWNILEAVEAAAHRLAARNGGEVAP